MLVLLYIFIFMLSTLHFGTISLNSLFNGKSDCSYLCYGLDILLWY